MEYKEYAMKKLLFALKDRIKQMFEDYEIISNLKKTQKTNK